MKKKLERLMYMGFGVLIAVGGYFFGTLHSDHVDAQIAPANVEYNEISCRSLTVVDEDGKPRIVLNTNPDLHGNVVIAILDVNRKPRIALSTFTDGNDGIAILDVNGKPRVVLGTDSDGEGKLYILDEKGNTVRALE